MEYAKAQRQKEMKKFESSGRNSRLDTPNDGKADFSALIVETYVRDRRIDVVITTEYLNAQPCRAGNDTSTPNKVSIE